MKHLARLATGLLLWLACVFGAVVALIWMIFTLPAAARGTGYRFLRIAVGFDCAASACFGGDGHTTISTRAKLATQAGRRWGCLLCKILDSIQPEHCENA